MATLMLTAGVGPAECRLAVQGVAEALIEEAEALGMEACAAKITEDRSGEGWVSAVLRVDGEGASAWAAGVAGTLRWTCPSTRKEGRRRKNWFVGELRSVVRMPTCPSSPASRVSIAVARILGSAVRMTLDGSSSLIEQAMLSM